jgi:hypothetical protein
MAVGLELVLLLAMTSPHHLLNVSRSAGFGAFNSDKTRRKTRHLDISKRFMLLRNMIRRCSVASSIPTTFTGAFRTLNPKNVLWITIESLYTIIQWSSTWYFVSARLPAKTPSCSCKGHE